MAYFAPNVDQTTGAAIPNFYQGVTYLSKVIVPEIFAPYFQVRTAEKSQVLQSGIAQSNGQLVNFASGAGQTYHMPFFNDLSGEDDVILENKDITVTNINAQQEICVVLNRAKAWGAGYLARMESGDDLMNRIGTLLSDWWARRHQAILLSVLNAMFRYDPAGSGTAGWGEIRDTHLVDNSAVTTGFSPNMIIDAMGKLGDASGNLAAMVMHSAIYHSLTKEDMIDYERPSETSIAWPTYLGKRIIVDDACTSERPGVFRTYLFQQGAIQMGMGNIPPRDAVETDRDTLLSEDLLVTRQRMIFHPKGFRWAGPVNPTNADLAAPGSWDRVIEDKLVSMVALECLPAS